MAASGLDDQSLMPVRVAALVAVDAPTGLVLLNECSRDADATLTVRG